MLFVTMPLTKQVLPELYYTGSVKNIYTIRICYNGLLEVKFSLTQHSTAFYTTELRFHIQDIMHHIPMHAQYSLHRSMEWFG